MRKKELLAAGQDEQEQDAEVDEKIAVMEDIIFNISSSKLNAPNLER